jgi:hypothetical protein
MFDSDIYTHIHAHTYIHLNSRSAQCLLRACTLIIRMFCKHVGAYTYIDTYTHTYNIYTHAYISEKNVSAGLARWKAHGRTYIHTYTHKYIHT